MNTIQVIGTADINRQLFLFEQRLSKKILNQSLRKVSRPIIATIKSNITAKIRKRTGTLIRSIGAWFYKESPNAIYVGPKTGKRAKYDAWYAHFLEFGTSGFGKRSRSWSSKLITSKSGFTYRAKTGKTTGYARSGGGIQARPFMRPAWDAHKGRVQEELRKDLKLQLGL